MSYTLIERVQAWGRPRVLVIGDLILDRYIWGNAERISQEAPVILLREEKQEVRLGGAANVANMVIGLECDVTLAGVTGNDRDADEFMAVLKKRGISTEAILPDSNRPTTVKERLLGHAQHRHPHQMLRIDRESREPLDALMTMKLLDRLVHLIPQHDAVLISDYAKGVCTPEILLRVIQVCRSADIPCIVDPALNADYNHYRGATLATPNRTETSKAAGREIKSIANAQQIGTELAQKYELDAMFVTLDRDGIVVSPKDGPAEHHPTRIRDVCDITGAGDMVLASIGVGAAAGLSFGDLAKLANIAGGLEVEQVGVVCISRQDMIVDLLKGHRNSQDKICHLEVLDLHVKARKQTGHKVVLTNGCFDVLHIGHVSYLKQARAEGDCLVVAINSDESVRSLGKASDRPIFPVEQRAQMLASLECVDYVTVFNESTPHQVLWKIQPDVLVKGGTYSVDEIVGKEVVTGYGGTVKALGEVPGISTTEILRRLRGEVADNVIPMNNARKAA
jgi:D-beta-D-heptose 7-phosphate kinase/D-beta-D-heptose 1-phosphate adenosyltransferase